MKDMFPENTNVCTVTNRTYYVGATEIIRKYCCKCHVNLEHFSESRVDATESVHWYRCPKCREIFRDTLKYPRIVYYTMNDSKVERYETAL